MYTNPTALWTGKIFLLAGAMTLGFGSLSHAQCCNSASAGFESGIEYGMPMAMGAIDPADQLIEQDDPTKMVNLTVVVPEKAKVKVNGEPTFTTGVVRPYVVRDLKPGKQYKFLIEGEFVNETGAVYYAKDEVTLDAGSSKHVVLKLRRVKRPDPPKPGAPGAPAPIAQPAV